MTILRRHKRLSAAASVLAACGVLAGVALADNVINDVVVNDTDTITAGGSTTVNYHISATGAGNDGQGGCNAADATPATVTINAPAGVTATPSQLSFTSCGTSNEKPVVFSSNAAGNYPITASVSDAGVGSYSTSQANFTLRVNAVTPSDTTAPVITPTVVGTLGNNGWYTSDVTLSWDVSDAQSTVSSTSGCETTSITADQGPTDYTCTATSAGGTDSKMVSIKRDATAPTVGFNGGPANGGTYFPLTVPAAPTCVGSDTTSLLASCIISGYSTGVGPQTMTATAEDNAGNTAIATRSYTVRPPFTLGGFFQPVDMNGMVNTVKNGATVPLKFTVLDGGVAQTSTSVVSSFRQIKVPCDDSLTADDIEIVSTGGTSLRYDATGGQFIQNWQTPKQVGACYTATVTFISNQTISANFKLK